MFVASIFITLLVPVVFFETHVLVAKFSETLKVFAGFLNGHVVMASVFKTLFVIIAFFKTSVSLPKYNWFL